jgi:hypothetical protein
MADRTQEEAKTDVQVENGTLRTKPTRKNLGSFRKSALVTVLVAFFVYSYQVCLHRIPQRWKRNEYLSVQRGYWIKSVEVDEPFLETVWSRVEIKADIPKKDAIVEAFKVIY